MPCSMDASVDTRGSERTSTPPAGGELAALANAVSSIATAIPPAELSEIGFAPADARSNPVDALARMCAAAKRVAVELDWEESDPRRAEFQRAVEQLNTVHDFAQRVLHGHDGGRDVRGASYALVVRALDQISKEFPETAAALTQAVARHLELNPPGAALPLDLLKGDAEDGANERIHGGRFGARISALWRGLGALCSDLLDGALAGVARVAAPVLLPVVGLLTMVGGAVRRAVAGVRLPGMRKVWRGGDPSRNARSRSNRKELGEGKIRTNDASFYTHTAVSDAYVPTGTDGELTRLDVYLDRVNRTVSAERRIAVSELFPERTVGGIAGERKEHQTECEFEIRKGHLSLPLAPAFKTVALSFYDARGQEIPAKAGHAIMEGVFGGLIVEAPRGTRKIIYRVERDEKRLSHDLIKRLNGLLPVLPSYQSEPEQLFLKLLKELPVDDRTKADLWFAAAAHKGFIYSMDGFVGEYLENAGAALNELMAGLRIGMCDSFSFHAAIQLRAAGLPALTVAGGTPRENTESFLLNPGHAQAIVAIPDGMRTIDLTTVSVERESKALGGSWLERRDELDRVRRATRRGAFESADVVRRKLCHSHSYPEGEHRPTWFGALFGQRDRSTVDGRKEYRCTLPGFLSYDLRADEGGRLAPEQRPAAAGMQALTHCLQLERLIERGMQEGTFGPVFEFESSHRSYPEITPEILRELPARYRCLEGYAPHRRVLDAVYEICVSERVSTTLRAEAHDWLVRQTTGHSTADGVLDEGRDLMVPWRTVGTARFGCDIAARFADDAVLTHMTDDALRAFARSICVDPALRVASKAVLDGERFDTYHPPSPFQPDGLSERGIGSYANALGCALRHLELRAISPGPAAAREMMACCVAMGVSLSRCDRPGATEARRAVGDLFDYLLAHSAPSRAEALVHFLNRYELAADLFPEFLAGGRTLGGHGWTGELGAPRGAAEMGRGIECAVERGLWLETGEPETFDRAVDYSRTFTALKRAGFEFSCAAMGDALERAVTRGLAKLDEAREERINFPTEETPASTLLADTARMNFPRLYRTVRAFSEHGGPPLEAWRKIWPNVNERKVAESLADRVQGGNGAFNREKHLTLGNVPLDWAVRAGRLRMLYDGVFAPSPALDTVLRFLEARGAFDHPFDAPLRKIAETYPRQWMTVLKSYGVGGSEPHDVQALSRLRDGMEADMVALLFRGSSPERVYRAMRWLAAEMIERVPDGEEVSRWSLPFKPRDRAEVGARFTRHAAVQEAFELLSREEQPGAVPMYRRPEFTRIFRHANLSEYADLTHEERAAAVLACVYGVGVNGQFLGARSFEQCSVPEKITGVLGGVIADDGRDPARQVWNHIFGWHGGRLDTSSILKSAESRVDMALRERTTMNGVYARYLYDRIGRLTPLSPAGDFESLRQYVHGDDPRTFDWRATARSTKVLVKHKRDRETRPVCLVVDAEWLLEGIDPKSSRRKVEVAPRLEELYTHLLLAERQRIGIEVRIVARTTLGTFEKLVVPGMGRARFREAPFAEDLGRIIKGALPVLEAEKTIFGESGFPPRNVFSALDTELPRDAVVIAAIARKNIGASLGTIESLRSRGKHVFVLRD